MENTKTFGKKIWKISQTHNNNYDTYDSAIVCADTEKEAQETEVGSTDTYGSWVKPEYVSVEYIGEAKEGLEKGIIVASFNAG